MSISSKKFSVDFTYLSKQKREIYLTKEIEGENIEEVAIKLEKIYNKVIIKSYKII